MFLAPETQAKQMKGKIWSFLRQVGGGGRKGVPSLLPLLARKAASTCKYIFFFGGWLGSGVHDIIFPLHMSVERAKRAGKCKERIEIVSDALRGSVLARFCKVGRKEAVTDREGGHDPSLPVQVCPS